DRARARAASRGLAKAVCAGAESTAGFGHGDSENGASTEDAGGQEALRAAQANTRAGLRHHQIGDGVPTIPAARVRQRQRRMESGDDELEHPADVRVEHGLNSELRLLPHADSPYLFAYTAIA